MELQTRFQDAHSLNTPIRQLLNHQCVQNEMRVQPVGVCMYTADIRIFALTVLMLQQS